MNLGEAVRSPHETEPDAATQPAGADSRALLRSLVQCEL